MTRNRREFLHALTGLGVCACSPAAVPSAAQRDARERDGVEAPAPAKSVPASSTPLGALDQVPASLHPAFASEGHEPPPAALAMDTEAPQTFADFLAERPPQRDVRAQRIALLPIGEYPHGFIVEYGAARLVRSPPLEVLARFARAWFGLEVELLPAMPDVVLEALPAREHDGRRQLDAEAVLDWLETQRPADASAVLALTLSDLFTADSQWLFGYASVGARVGVYSLLRYDPGFVDTGARGPAFRQVIRDRALRVVAHELAHMFGLRHCAHFRCIMNPTAGLADLDALPLRLCPVCLRKLWRATGVPLVERWRNLCDVCDGLGLHKEHDWYVDRMRRLGIDD